jgi:hypothetical protein
MYAGGIGAVAAGEYETLAALLTEGERSDSQGRAWPIFLTLRTHDVLTPEVAQMLPGMERKYVLVRALTT